MKSWSYRTLKDLGLVIFTFSLARTEVLEGDEKLPRVLENHMDIFIDTNHFHLAFFSIEK